MLNFCVKYFKKYKFYFFVFYFLIIISGGLKLLVPLLNGRIIDLIVATKVSILKRYILYFFIVNLLLILFNFISNRIYIVLQTNTAYDIISKILKHIQHLPLKLIETFDIGYLNQRINNDSNSITTFAINLIGNFTTNTIVLIISIYILFNMNHTIGFVMLGIGCIYVLIYSLLKHYIYSISFKIKEEQALFFSAMLMQLRDIKFIKIHSLIDEYQNKMDSSYKTYYKNVVKAQNFFFIYSSLDSVITIIGNILIFIIGGDLVMNSTLTIGDFSIIITYFNYIINNFKYFSSLGKDFQDNKVSYTRLVELFNLKAECDGEIEIEEITQLVCRNLTFERGSKTLFSNFNYTFTPGKSYCICGENGKGKTTFIETLIGLHQNEYSGQILYNNVDINAINTYELRYKKISIMEQQIHLLEGNIQNNILLTSNHTFSNLIENIDIEDKNAVINFIKKMNKINNSGDGISGGEREKIGLYRLLSQNADIYILDEPTASLDKKSINKFINYINNIKQHKIIIIISHDSRIINQCDNIIEL